MSQTGVLPGGDHGTILKVAHLMNAGDWPSVSFTFFPFSLLNSIERVNEFSISQLLK